MKSLNCEVAILGGGPGGYAAAIRLGHLKKECVLIEKEKMGGTCLNVGCIPSKSLIHAASQYHHIVSDGQTLGITVKEATIDWKRSIQWKDGLVKKIVGGVDFLLKKNNVQVVQGEGELTSPTTITTKEVNITAQHIILATGSSPVELPTFPFDHQDILNSTDVLALEEIPPTMVILGGGVIGMELGFAYQLVGCQVTIIEMLPNVLPSCEKTAAAIVVKEFQKLGGTIITGAKAINYDKKKKIVLRYQLKDKEHQIECHKIFVAVGRKANYDNLNLEKNDIKTDKYKIVVDEQLQTNQKNVYAIGDIIDGPMLAHKATAEGIMVAEHLSGIKVSREDIRCIPDVIYTKPEIASVGVSEQIAREKGWKVLVGKFPLAALGRAQTTNENNGYIKYIAREEDERIIGGVIVAERASDLIAEVTLAIEMCATLEDVASTVHAHPTFSEAHMEAAAAALKKAIHVVNY